MRVLVNRTCCWMAIALVVTVAASASSPSLLALPQDARESQADRASMDSDSLPVVRRARNATHFRLPDGSIRAVVTIRSHNYRDAAGQWRPIIAALEPGPVGSGIAYHNRENSLISQFPQRLHDGVRLTGHGLAFEPLVMRPVELVALDDGRAVATLPAQPAFAEQADAKTVHYPGVFPLAFDEYVLAPDRVKHSLVLREPAALAGFEHGDTLGATFAVSVPAGLTVQQTTNTVRLIDAAGECLYELGPVVNVDADDTSVAGAFRVEQAGQELRLTMTVATEWLLAAERAWPVRMDPQVTLQPGANTSKDTFVRENAPGNNYGTNSYLSHNYGTTSGALEPMLQFDLSSIPQGATINSAEFAWWHTSNNGLNDVVRTYVITGTWQEMSVTWSTKPPRAANHFDELTYPSGTGAWRTFTGFASAVQDWVDGTVTNYGFYVLNTSRPPFITYHYASDNSNPEHPKLTIDYTDAPQVNSVAPNPIDWLQTLTITGTNFTGATDVTIGGVSQSILSVSATQIEVTVSDATPVGSQPLVVERNGTLSNAVNLTVNALAPTITGLSPNPVNWLQSLTINGNALAGATNVTIGGVAQTITSATTTSLSVLVSDSTPLGLQTVEITTAGGTDSTLSVTVDGVAPTITTVAPSTAEWFDTLTLTGTALSNATNVTVAGAEATIMSNTANEIQFEVPVTTAGGAVNIEVTTAFGSDTAQVTLTGVVPVVTSITPGSVFSGSSITITGTNLIGVYLVEVGDAEATIQSVSDTEVVAKLNPLTHLGSQVVTVTTAFGSDANHSVTVRIRTGSSNCGALSGNSYPGMLPLTLLVTLFALFVVRRRLTA